VACACHGHFVDVFDVTGENGVDAVADCLWDGVVGAFGSSGGGEDEHVEVE